MGNQDVKLPSLPKLDRCRFFFVCVIAAIAIASGGIILYTARLFGWSNALGLLAVLALPIVLAIVMAVRVKRMQSLDVGLLMVLFTVAFGASIFLVMEWKRSGLDRIFTEGLEHARFRAEVESDARFRNVVIFVSRRNILSMHGFVETTDDLDRLRKMARQHRMAWMDDVCVAENSMQ